MLVIPENRQQNESLSLVLSSVERCSVCPDNCDGRRWVWDSEQKTAVRVSCPHASDIVRERDVLSLAKSAGISPDTRPIVCPWLRGLTVVCPEWRVKTVDDELEIRRVTSGIVYGWIVEHQTPALYQPYYMTKSFWRDDISLWKRIPMAAFVGWHFRGLREEHAVAFNDVLLTRLDKQLPTVVSLSADPSLLTPRMNVDEPIVDALRKPDFFVRVGRSKPTANKA